MNREIGERDAIHVPIICLTAHENLSPGEQIGIGQDKTATGTIGIVNPFGPKVTRGDPCEVWLSPGSTEGVRHVWSHSEIDSSKPKIEPLPPVDWDTYLDRIATRLEIETCDLLSAAYHFEETGSKVGGSQAEWNKDADIDWVEFWKKYNEEFKTNVRCETDPFCC